MRSDLPPPGPFRDRLHAFANALQGYYNVLVDMVPSQTQSEAIAAEIVGLNIKDAELLPGWEVVHLPAIAKGQLDEAVEGGLGAAADAPELWLLRGPMHRHRGVKWAGGPGFSGPRNATLNFLTQAWLADLAQRLAAIQAEATARAEADAIAAAEAAQKDSE